MRLESTAVPFFIHGGSQENLVYKILTNSSLVVLWLGNIAEVRHDEKYMTETYEYFVSLCVHVMYYLLNILLCILYKVLFIVLFIIYVYYIIFFMNYYSSYEKYYITFINLEFVKFNFIDLL